MSITRLNQCQHNLLLEIDNVEEQIALLRDRIAEGKPVGGHCALDINKFNYLLGQFSALYDEVNKPEQLSENEWLKREAQKLKQPLKTVSVPELVADHKAWEAQRAQDREGNE